MKTAEKLITENLEVWSLTVRTKSSTGRGSSKKRELYGISKVRKLILELAIRGMLVPQDPNDKPALELLKSIATQKAKLIESGEIKNQKNLPPVSANEIAFAPPLGWEWTRLQEVSEYIQRGKGPKYSDTGSVRVVSQKCIQWSGFNSNVARFVADGSLDKYQPERFLRSNDLLWNSTGTGTAGRINRIDDIDENTLVADSHVTVVRPLSFNSSFLCCFISSPGIQKRLLPTHEDSLVSGTTNQVELNSSSVKTLPVPLPPLAEQHRIMAKVDELMALCDRLEQEQESSLGSHDTLVTTLLGALTTASAQGSAFAEAWQRIQANFDTLFTTETSIDQLKQTILQLAVMGKLVPQDPEDEPASELIKKIARQKQQLFKEKKLKKQKPLPLIAEDEKPFPVPAGWNWARLEETIIQVTDGEHISPLKTSSGVKLLTAKHIRAEGVTLADPQFVSENDAKKFLLRCNPEIGDIFICSRGTIGRSCVNEIEETFCLMGSVILLKKSDQIHPYYLEYFIKSRIGQLFIRGVTKGMAVNALYLKDVKLCPVPIPPLVEQHRIAEKVDELMALCDQLKAKLANTKTTQLHLADSLVEQAIG